MEKVMWWTRLWWWITGESTLQVHEAPELCGEIEDDELTKEVLSEIFGGVLFRQFGESNA